MLIAVDQVTTLLVDAVFFMPIKQSCGRSSLHDIVNDQVLVVKEEEFLRVAVE